jgi:methyl-CpG-binding domain protein 4
MNLKLSNKTVWNPPLSPWNLVQEPYFGDEWKILVCCLLLNLTSHKQVRKILHKLFRKYPEPAAMSMAKEEELKILLKPLGLVNKRAKTLIRFSQEYLTKDWKTAKDLYGCGKYADDAWHIFCVGDWKSVEPNDHALDYYHSWLKET